MVELTGEMIVLQFPFTSSIVLLYFSVLFLALPKFLILSFLLL
jgi:hypothetical protein